MAGGAAGGFVTRAFESMLKECTNKKYPALQSAIQTYLDGGTVKDSNQQSKTKEAISAPSNQSLSELDSEAGKTEIDGDHSVGATSAAEEVESTSKPTITRESITVLLAKAGYTLKGAEAELVLNPLRLAFETKNMKVVELALDCLHKLIEYSHLEGDPGLDGGKDAQLFADILNMVCNSVDNSSPDSTTLQVLKVLLTAVASTKIRVHGEPLVGVIRVCYNIALNSKSPINQATAKAMLTQILSVIFRRMETNVVSQTSSNSVEIKKPHSTHLSTPMVEEVSSGDHDEPSVTLREALSVKQINDASLPSVNEIQGLVGGTDIKGLEAVLEKAVDLEDGGKVSREVGSDSTSVGQRDALLLFRTLCKMGMKEDNDEVTTKTRILSLELMQGLLEGVSFSFTKNFKFIDSIRAHLSYTLLRASMSQSPVLSQYATGIFAVLLLRFRESLKAEIGVFFPVIILRPLDGSDLNQKLTVLRMLEKACKDPQMLIDLYVNYDCDLEAPNLFERMVSTLSKIAQGTHNMDPKSAGTSQTGQMRTASMQGLVNVLKSLSIWEKSCRESGKHNNVEEPSGKEVSFREIDEFKSKDEYDLPSNFEKLKAHKSTIEAVVSEFNRKPEKGIQHLISSGLVEKTPAAVATFLRNTPNLDKAMLGDYLGQHEEFPLSVMHSYVDSMNFSGMKFDVAIREFLNGFRLPGEAQKIDRIMEKFAERYCADNPGLFKNADTAYVLAYAVIMLNTDAHNPMVWPKMSKSDFVRMNASNDPEESAPQELLEEIYDSIVKKEIKMKDDPAGILKNSMQKPEVEERGLISILNLALPKSSLTDSKSENEAIVKQIQAVIKDQGGKRGVFYTSHRIEIVRLMVEAVGWPLLATFAVTMGEIDNKPRITLCMEGFKEGIHITHVLGMDTMRYAFLTSLIRYNFLHAPRDMRGKNVEALRTLLTLCDSDIYAFQDSWFAILECISRLEYIVSSPAITAIVMQASNQISRDALLQSLKELGGKPTEKVFVNSIKLPSETVVEFFTALCSVSAEELKQVPARVFGLQKVVEISYYNMGRIRMVWARIWSVLAHHFIFAGSHPDEKVAMYAIDSLRQLAMKYLERDELANFTFQNDILKPFVVLIRSSRSESIRRLIVDCIVQMVKSKVGSIKSGWRSVFMIFTAAADDDLEATIESAFENVEQVVLEHFDQVVGDCFMDCVNCLIGFANGKSSPRISLKAIALLRICEDRLAEGLIPGGALKPIDASADETSDVTEHYWFPMLAGLSDLTSDPRPEVRNCALEVLFDLLNERGSKFSSSFWENIFQQVLFPIFDNVRHAGSESFPPSGDEWLRESSVHSLQLLCNLFNTFYKDVCFMLPQLLSLLLDCAKKTDQSVVAISLGALVHLVEVGGLQFSDDDWDTLLKSIRDASYTTQPLELLNNLGFENTKHQALMRGLESPSSVAIGGEISVDRHNTIYENGNTLGVDGSVDETADDHNQEMARPANIEGSEGIPSPSGQTTRPTDGGGLDRNQTFGQKFMGNMMDNLFTRSFTSKPKSHKSDEHVPSSPAKIPVTVVESDPRDEESPLMGNIRSKCITQLLLLGVIDGIQKKYWNRLKSEQKITVMEILFSLLEFAASYNSFTNLKLRMHQISSERPPPNLLRQEFAATSIYLDILQKTTTLVDLDNEEDAKEGRLQGIAEGKLTSFCEQVLREASDFQGSMEESTNMDVHRLLQLRSPIIVKVLNGMCQMNSQIFKNHLRDFYPFITKLVCCDQMEVRRALTQLFKMQLNTLLQ